MSWRVMSCATGPRRELAALRHYAELIASVNGLRSELIEYFLSTNCSGDMDLFRVLDQSGVKVRPHAQYEYWPVVMRLMAALWRSQEPIIWVVTEQESRHF